MTGLFKGLIGWSIYLALLRTMSPNVVPMDMLQLGTAIIIAGAIAHSEK